MFSTDALGTWLAGELDARWSSVDVSRLPGGHSSGAWRVNIRGDDATAPLVLKAPEEPSVVYGRDPGREAHILDAVGRMGAPVPAVLAIDDVGRAIGRPCFVMEYVTGRGLDDTSLASYHGDPWLLGTGTETQRAVWNSFHDALAMLHSVDPARVPDAGSGPCGVVDVLAYWRAALLDAAPAATVPRELAILDWLGANLPTDADDEMAVCMGDARLVNSLIDGVEVRALVDFEVAYIGNPAADIGYSLFVDRLFRRNTERPLPGVPSADETWSRWSRATGRTVKDPGYWIAFAATILCVTATRAMIQWGLSGAAVESDNPVVPAWKAAAERAAG